MITVLSLSPAVDKIYFINDFSAGELYRVKNPLKSAGGKGINVARVVSMLGEDTNVLGFKAGKNGQWLEDCLKSIGVNTDFKDVQGESRTNNNIIDEINHRETEILEDGPWIDEDTWANFSDIFCQKLKNTDILVCSGGLPKGLGVDTYAQLIQKANEYGIKTILDSSGDVLNEGLKSKPYMIKPNLRELENYSSRLLKDNKVDSDKKFSSDEDIINVCRQIINQGIEVVVTSLGADGAIMVTKDAAYRALPVEIDVVNTIGSGDSMVAGLCTGLVRGYNLEECLRLGSACAISNAELSEIGMIKHNRVKDIRNQVVITSLT